MTPKNIYNIHGCYIHIGANVAEGYRQFAPQRHFQRRPSMRAMCNQFGYCSPVENFDKVDSAGHPCGAISGGVGYISASLITNDLGVKTWWVPWDPRKALESLPADELTSVMEMSIDLQNVVFPALKEHVAFFTGQVINADGGATHC